MEKHWPHQDCTLFLNYKSWINPDIKALLKGLYNNEQMWARKEKKKKYGVILDTQTDNLT